LLKRFAENEPSIVVHRSLTLFVRGLPQMRNLWAMNKAESGPCDARVGMSPYCQIHIRTLKPNPNDRKLE